MSAVRDITLKPCGYQKITGLNTATGLTVPTAAGKTGAKYVLLKTETQSVRWRDDGTNPNSTDGIMIDVGDEFWYTGDLRAIKFIETTASATLHVSYYA